MQEQLGEYKMAVQDFIFSIIYLFLSCTKIIYV